jgi:hypothetical protein
VGVAHKLKMAERPVDQEKKSGSDLVLLLLKL